MKNIKTAQFAKQNCLVFATTNCEKMSQSQGALVKFNACQCIFPHNRFTE